LALGFLAEPGFVFVPLSFVSLGGLAMGKGMGNGKLSVFLNS